MLAQLRALTATHGIAAGVIVSAVGSLREARLRFAGASTASLVPGPLEILALSGTLSAQGGHLHLAVADADGRCRGGHLLAGCVVHTTLELLVASLAGVRFLRQPDPATGYRELHIEPLSGPP